METILVALDGSPAAEKALDVGLDLAQQHGATLRLLHVLLRDKEVTELLNLPELGKAEPNLTAELNSLIASPASEPSVTEIMAQPEVALHPASETQLRQVGAFVLARAQGQAEARGLDVTSLPLADGPPAAAITGAAKSHDADVIVMGTRGLRPIDNVTFGSVSQEVCRRAHCTCIAVH